MKCRVKKFKRITIALLTLTGFYVIFMVYKLGSYSSSQLLDGGEAHRVVWKPPYWLLDDDSEDYQVPEFEDDRDSARVYPYKGIKSEILSIRRTLRDTRPLECRLISYSYELMPVTIVIVFHNEYIGVILRSLYSIVTHTPKELITEIVLVDDASTQHYLHTELEAYIDKTRVAFNKIRIIRLPKRIGANRAVLEAIKTTHSDHVVLMTQVLDVNKNWLPPLLQPIAKNPKTISVPVHEYRHFRENGSEILDQRGLFDLELKYMELPRLKETMDSTNFRSPIISPKGVFVVSKSYLKSINLGPIGGQDGNFIELSIKTWACGGRIVKVPCSRVSHNYRESGLHDAYIHDKSLTNQQLRYTIETWFDDYAEVYLNLSPKRFSLPSVPVSDDPKLRPTCKSFTWFISKVASDLKPLLAPPTVLRSGKIKNLGENLCLKEEQDVGAFLELVNCTEVATAYGLTRQSEVRPGRESFLCWEAYNEVNYRNVSARFVASQPCNTNKRRQKFVLAGMDQHIHHIEFDACLEAVGSEFVWLTSCDPDKDAQKWLLI